VQIEGHLQVQPYKLAQVANVACSTSITSL